MLMKTTRWTPWAELAGLHRDLDSIFGRFFGESGARPSAMGTPAAFTPAAEVWRDGDKWQVYLALPGVAPDKVEIDVVGRTVRVRGERVAPQHGDAEPAISEFSYGRFEREFTLPEEIDTQKVHAVYRHGLLELELPLSEGAKPHRVAIQAMPDAMRLAAA
jgi:HSP20 family protein